MDTLPITLLIKILSKNKNNTAGLRKVCLNFAILRVKINQIMFIITAEYFCWTAWLRTFV